MNVAAVLDHAAHTPFSDPGRHRALIDGVSTDLAKLSTVARNLIVHYRASGFDLPEAHRDDINARWLENTLDIDQRRFGRPLTEERPPTERVQGCCRDHTLFCVGVLRSHGVPARSRVGYAGYFLDGWQHDHVIVEAWLDGRWRRFDAEVEEGSDALPDPLDIGPCALDSRGFVTAAQVWAGHRAGEVDAETYGVDITVPVFRGERFVFDEVIYEIAHRFGDELLLWDGWGAIGEPGAPVADDEAAWMDDVAALLLAADGGDLAAEQALLDLYRTDSRLHPGPQIEQASPFGDPIRVIQLDR